MGEHRVGTREEWLAARIDLLAKEKELTRRSDELARARQELPWVRVEKDYTFETEEGSKSLADLFGGRSQLLVYHFMFGPDYSGGCPTCSSIADVFDGIVPHLNHRDVTFSAVSRAPLEKLLAYRRRMGWAFPWASSYESDFNFDYGVSFTEQEQREGAEYNFRSLPSMEPLIESGAAPIVEQAAATGTDPATYLAEGPGMSAFALSDGVVYHTYSAYSRGVDVLMNYYQWLDRAPKGRNEGEGFWIRRHDEYE
jgi:predicted dithiol-disulfide oxidoreductase (DUF899 family)